MVEVADRLQDVSDMLAHFCHLLDKEAEAGADLDREGVSVSTDDFIIAYIPKNNPDFVRYI